MKQGGRQATEQQQRDDEMNGLDGRDGSRVAHSFGRLRADGIAYWGSRSVGLCHAVDIAVTADDRCRYPFLNRFGVFTSS